MTIIEFSQYFPNENSCKLHFKEQRKSKGLLARDVMEPNTIGFKVSGNGNVQRVASELL